VLSLDLARRLKEAGATSEWKPSAGDRFVVPDRDMDQDVFAISDMVVEVYELPTGPLFAFTGTTEWALDSIEQRHVLWLPREDQLRRLLGDAFVALQATPGGFVVVVHRDGKDERHIDLDAEDAYARAVLAVVG
jgi:hypothetical protein